MPRSEANTYALLCNARDKTQGKGDASEAEVARLDAERADLMKQLAVLSDGANPAPSKDSAGTSFASIGRRLTRLAPSLHRASAVRDTSCVAQGYAGQDGGTRRRHTSPNAYAAARPEILADIHDSEWEAFQTSNTAA